MSPWSMVAAYSARGGSRERRSRTPRSPHHRPQARPSMPYATLERAGASGAGRPGLTNGGEQRIARLVQSVFYVGVPVMPWKI